MCDKTKPGTNITENEKKYLDPPGQCFGWCKQEITSFAKSMQSAMCSCRCSTWGKCNMRNTPPYNTAFDNIQMIKPERKSQKHRKRKKKLDNPT